MCTGHTLERPIYLNLLNNLSCEEPRITIKRDTFFAEFASDEQVTQQNLPAEIQRRNMACDHPIRVRYEWRYTLNLTLIETPGLKRVARGKVSQDRETIVMDEAKPPERTLVFVEEAKEAWDVEQVRVLPWTPIFFFLLFRYFFRLPLLTRMSNART